MVFFAATAASGSLAWSMICCHFQADSISVSLLAEPSRTFLPTGTTLLNGIGPLCSRSEPCARASAAHVRALGEGGRRGRAP